MKGKKKANRLFEDRCGFALINSQRPVKLGELFRSRDFQSFLHQAEAMHRGHSPFTVRFFPFFAKFFKFTAVTSLMAVMLLVLPCMKCELSCFRYA